jgi:hypothetical protein
MIAQRAPREAGGIVLFALLLSGLTLAVSPAHAQVIDPFYAGSYTAYDLGEAPGVPPLYGGMTFMYNDPNKIILGGNANDAPGALYTLDVVRGADNHITGFSGPATYFAECAYNDGGVIYGPGDVLFTARWPINFLGELKPGSTTTDKLIDLSAFGVGGSSISALNFVPSTFGGAGRLKMVSWDQGNWYEAGYAPDGGGTYDITGVTALPGSNLTGGPEGFVYVSQTSAQFGTPSMLVSEFSNGTVSAYEVDGNGDPIPGTRHLFMSDITGAEGATFDPLTGDFMFSTFGAVSRIVSVRGFDLPPPPPPPVPEPSSLALLGFGLSGLGWAVSRGRRKWGRKAA